MSRICPITNERVLYPECMECTERRCRIPAKEERIMIERTTFNDGDRFVIVYKNCDAEMKKKILMALAQVEIDLPESTVTEAESANVAPISDPVPVCPEIPEEGQEPEKKEEEYSPVFTTGRYQGLSPAEVLEQHGDQGCGNLSYLKARSKDPRQKAAIEEAMRSYFKKRFSKEDPKALCSKWKEEQADLFFKYYIGIMSEGDKQTVLKKVGAIDFDSYLEGAPMDHKLSLAVALLEKYAKR